MGFNEDDRIRYKNAQYNLPTPSINSAARKLISDISLIGSQLIGDQFIVDELEHMLDHSTHDSEVVTTAIAIIKKEKYNPLYSLFFI